MALREICNSCYTHQPITSFGKKYYKMMSKDTRICEECIEAYIKEAGSALAKAILRCDIPDIKYYNSEDERDSKFMLQFPVEISKYMEYILPTVFSLKVNFDDYFHQNAEISPCPNDTKFSGPIFNLKFNIVDDDSLESVTTIIEEYLNAYIMSTFIEIPENEVQILMDNYGIPSYDSATSSTPAVCAACGASVIGERYFYRNHSYCLNCMYEIVVDNAVKSNITKAIGIAFDQFTTTTAIVNTVEYKRSVIDKYINVMTSLGANPNIVHYMMTLH